MQIIDNVLSQEDYNILKQIVLSDRFKWDYHNHTAYENENLYQFVHSVSWSDRVDDKDINIVVPTILHRLGLKQANVIRSKFNLLTRQPYTDEDLKLSIHQDITDKDKKAKSFLYYINDSDGDTVFYTDKQINVTPKANTGILFDSTIKHRATPPTINKARYVLNIIFTD